MCILQPVGRVGAREAFNETTWCLVSVHESGNQLLAYERETGVGCDARLGCSKPTPPARKRVRHSRCTLPHTVPSTGATPNTSLRNHLYRPPSLLSHETSPPSIWPSYHHTSHILKPADCGPHSAFAPDKVEHRTHHAAGHLSPWPHASSSRRSTRCGCQCDVSAGRAR